VASRRREVTGVWCRYGTACSTSAPAGEVRTVDWRRRERSAWCRGEPPRYRCRPQRMPRSATILTVATTVPALVLEDAYVLIAKRRGTRWPRSSSRCMVGGGWGRRWAGAAPAREENVEPVLCRRFTSPGCRDVELRAIGTAADAGRHRTTLKPLPVLATSVTESA